MKYCNELARITDRRYIWPFYLNSQLSKTTKLFIFSALHPCVSISLLRIVVLGRRSDFHLFFCRVCLIVCRMVFGVRLLRSSLMSYYYRSIDTNRGNRQTLTIFAGDIFQCILHENLQLYKHEY